MGEKPQLAVPHPLISALNERINGNDDGGDAHHDGGGAYHVGGSGGPGRVYHGNGHDRAGSSPDFQRFGSFG